MNRKGESSMEERILAILAEIKEGVDFKTSDSLVKDGLLKSIDIIFLVAELNESFDVTIPASEVIPNNFNSVSAICGLIERLSNE